MSEIEYTQQNSKACVKHAGIYRLDTNLFIGTRFHEEQE